MPVSGSLKQPLAEASLAHQARCRCKRDKCFRGCRQLLSPVDFCPQDGRFEKETAIKVGRLARISNAEDAALGSKKTRKPVTINSP